MGREGVNVAKVGGYNEATFRWSQAVGFAGDFFLPEGFASGGVENGDLVVEADDELVSSDDEFEGGRVRDLPKEACFEFGFGVGEVFFEAFDFGGVGFDFWIEFFELCLVRCESGFESAFSSQVEALKFVD